MIPANTAFDILGLILDSQTPAYTMLVKESPPLVFVTRKQGAASLPTEMLVVPEGRGPEEKHELATLIVVLQYVSVDDMQNLLRNFKSTECVMTAYPAGNFLILKDEEAKLKYLLDLIKKIDVAGTASKVTMVELKYADATETAAQLTELLAAREGGQVVTALRRPPTPGRTTTQRPGTPASPTGASPSIVGTATPLKLLADTRTNRLIILASEKDTEYVLKLVTSLDVEPTEDMYPIRTYIAQYQNAEDLADTLASFVGGRPRTTAGRQTARTTARTRAVGTARGAAQARPTGPSAARGAVAGGTEEAFFLADPATNMILIQAAPQKLDMYFGLLKELDQPQKQVLIEVWVVEISSRSQLDIGVEFQSAEIGPMDRIGPMQNQILGGSSFDLGLGDLLAGGFPSSGISLGIRTLTNTALDVGGKAFYLPNIDTFLRALKEDTTFNILSSPKLMTLNNEPASVDISDEISIAESRIGYGTAQQETADPGYYPGTYTETFQREQVGINLQILPQINSENSVIMDIDLVVGSIAGVEDLTQAGSRPVIATRSTVTRVRVDNGRTVVISGLRRTDKTRSTTRVPILGQIPILGVLFSHSRTLTVNTNLFIFITPHIISDTLDMLAVTDLVKNQDLEKERSRFQPATTTRKRRPSRKAREPGWEWKK